MKRKRRRKKRGIKIALKTKWTALLIVLLLVISLSLYFFVFFPSPVYEAIPYTAAIIDQLSFTHQNMTFVQTVSEALASAGFSVDYCNYSQVTVDFYRQLPSRRYSLILLRVHSGVGQYSGLTTVYTVENYTDWGYFWEQVNKQVVAVEYVLDGPKYFAITSNFVRGLSVCRNSTVIMMGCDGLKVNNTDMAEAFIEKGANVYISWDGPVSPGHTDKATAELIRNIVSKNQTIEKAIDDVMNTVGSDPYYQSRLAYYPSQAKDYKITKTFHEEDCQFLMARIELFSRNQVKQKV